MKRPIDQEILAKLADEISDDLKPSNRRSIGD